MWVFVRCSHALEGTRGMLRPNGTAATSKRWTIVRGGPRNLNSAVSGFPA